MPALDLRPATDQLAAVVRGVDDDQLDAPTPCPEMPVGALLDHMGMLALAFTRAADRTAGDDGPPPPMDAANLPEDWREEIPTRLDALAAAWQSPEAWTGTTRAGGLDLSGEEAGVVALDEVVLHGWDLAVATGQPFTVDPDLLPAVHGFVEATAAPEMADAREGLFGPVVEVDDDASPLERVLALAGRDPRWSPTA
ncbi:TIGR03086 family metal-binding protein [Salsipaludibacter albus]|uniref:TIGR03086 family metal-binding protein n=1 Tax=Salsipaludibacter albus TaxID=2849650 RepID=UPI001EE44B8D|nr:TIGR03086 family metal-binding protein [Salsipaludibacter albus]MBY5161944.1 TIGR03086 family protein [Salsipaludibacter albus]